MYCSWITPAHQVCLAIYRIHYNLRFPCSQSHVNQLGGTELSKFEYGVVSSCPWFISTAGGSVSLAMMSSLMLESISSTDELIELGSVAPPELVIILPRF